MHNEVVAGEEIRSGGIPVSGQFQIKQNNNWIDKMDCARCSVHKIIEFVICLFFINEHIFLNSSFLNSSLKRRKIEANHPAVRHLMWWRHRNVLRTWRSLTRGQRGAVMCVYFSVDERCFCIILTLDRTRPFTQIGCPVTNSRCVAAADSTVFSPPIPLVWWRVLSLCRPTKHGGKYATFNLWRHLALEVPSYIKKIPT